MNERGQYGQPSDKEDMARFWKDHPTAEKAVGIGALAVGVGLAVTMVVTQFKIFHDAGGFAKKRPHHRHELPKAWLR